MSEPERFTIGTRVFCTDGECGELRRVVFNPVHEVLTHLVVEPVHHRRGGHLVPLELVAGSDERIRLSCSLADFEALPSADESQFLLSAGGAVGYEPDEALALPYYGLSLDDIDAGHMNTGRDYDISDTGAPASISYDRVPLGEVEVQRGDHVHATDGAVGRVRGLVIHPEDHHVTHLLLEEGHLFGAKEIAIPINAVLGVDDGVRISLSKDEVRDLPHVPVSHSH